MGYKPTIPNSTGVVRLSVEVSELLPYIDWKFFFRAWRLVGNYGELPTMCGCVACREAWLKGFVVEERPQAEQALQLWDDAQTMLQQLVASHEVRVEATTGIFRASSDGDAVTFYTDTQTVCIPMLRQQQAGEGGYCLSLADYVGEHDYVGAFAVAVHTPKVCGDDYQALLCSALCDRLAEAAAEWLHAEVRRHYWGFAADEQLSIDDMKRAKYQGIRPAVGYPSLPDQSMIFRLDALLHFADIGVELTENGAMLPSSSVCGLIIAHPAARYFMVGSISEAQLRCYAQRCGVEAAQVRRFLGVDIVE